jgi:hypothetical protein
MKKCNNCNCNKKCVRKDKDSKYNLFDPVNIIHWVKGCFNFVSVNL